MYLLDTNVISELRKAKSGKANTNLIAWAHTAPVSSQFLSCITILELELGVLRLEQRDQRQGAVLRAWLEERVLPALAGRVLPVDINVAQSCARLHVTDQRSERDALIAATALVHGMTVVTRNTEGFRLTGVALISPWDKAHC